MKILHAKRRKEDLLCSLLGSTQFNYASSRFKRKGNLPRGLWGYEISRVQILLDQEQSAIFWCFSDVANLRTLDHSDNNEKYYMKYTLILR